MSLGLIKVFDHKSNKLVSKAFKYLKHSSSLYTITLGYPLRKIFRIMSPLLRTGQAHTTVSVCMFTFYNLLSIIFK